MAQSADAFLGAPTADQFLGTPAPARAPVWSLDLIQQHAGPGQITSAQRSAARNAAVGGSPTSSHLSGDAFDFVPHDRNTARAALALSNAGIPYDQIIDEGDHVHIGWGPKMRGQFKPRGAVQQTADAFLGSDSYLGRVGRRGNEGVAQMREGYDQFTDPNAGFGEQGMAALNILGGGIKAVAAPISGYVERAAGPAWQALTGGPQAGAGDIADNLAAFALPGPKVAKGARGPKPVAPLIEGSARVVSDVAAPSAEEFLGAAPAAAENYTPRIVALGKQIEKRLGPELDDADWDKLNSLIEGSDPETRAMINEYDDLMQRRSYDAARPILEEAQRHLPPGWTASRRSSTGGGSDLPYARSHQTFVDIFNPEGGLVGSAQFPGDLKKKWFTRAMAGDTRSVHQRAIDSVHEMEGAPANDGPLDELAATLSEIGPKGRPSGDVVPLGQSAEEFLGIRQAVERGKANPTTMAADVEDPLDDILYAPRARRTGTLSLPEQVAPKQGITEGAKAMAASIQATLAPATKGLGAPAAAVIRRASAQGDLQAAQSAARLQRHAQLAAELPVEQQRGLVDYIENRSSGATIPDKRLQAMADDLRDVNESYRRRIGDVMEEGEGPSFIRDYYVHMWKEAPQVVEGRMAMSRQGSARNLKARSIPTLKEGIEAGLTPVTENPVEATMMYADNMSRYLATVDTQRTLADMGMTGWFGPGEAPEGWVPLKGIRTEKPGRLIIQDGETVGVHPSQTLYAPEDAARVYNNWISNGFDRGDMSVLFEFARKTANGMTMLKLGLSAFHATTMANEAAISELARGYSAASRGDVVGAGKAMAGAPAAPVTRYLRGARMTKELLGQANTKDAMSAAVNDAYVRAGGRVRMDRLYRTRQSGSMGNAIGQDVATFKQAPGFGQFVRLLKNGAWARDVKATGERIFGRDKLMVERLGGVADAVANLIQTTATPLFEHAIPRLKQGAFASTMEDWLRAHPNAGQAEIDAAAHAINRSIDNRFGEMAWDNLFWKRGLKQLSQLTLLSPTWNIGTINEIGGGMLDVLGPSAKGLLKGEGITPRTAYVLALATWVPVLNGIMTYLKTGKPPEGRDFMAYRTGGVDVASGQPERAMIPGYQKDVYGFGYHFPDHVGQEIANKLNPALKVAIELPSNRDWKDQPIRNPDDPLLAQAGQVGDYAVDQMMPISINQFGQGDKVGSKISTAEKMLAIRPAPAYIQSPERVDRLEKIRNRRDWRRKERFDRIDKARRKQ